MKRCDWVPKNNPLYEKYHDEEWGLPCHDERELFELIILEGAQAGLSWETVLKKRENYRAAFDNFDVKKVAKYDEKKVQELLQNAGIIRNRLKIRSSILNAQKFLEIQKEFGSFDKYIWSFVNYKVINNKFKTVGEIPAKTELSDKISQDLIKRGMKFVGSTIIYAYMQSIGMVNDHTTDCFRYNKV
ncbi:DNA-3-methyladenine glycosylase I [archaeon]|jgi:DNA-3-methyladenine glycosylase I|nr:DNA-3-methyladenine glycosylase I [archaeon]MBT4022400.1 DNA-3-methyladenine glycosylase I [archaeon]MBT4273278.1 DNA-3-methyladenine glycosylase I [archaeon]MBT4461279.1 DNA-3-methyladenine glycosylase I [archaeon]MBT4858576.1 DNA-3-methyladenine glycosylase I [archaeon]